MSKLVKEIMQDLANAIVSGDTMVPACSVGVLLEYIEDLQDSNGCNEDGWDLYEDQTRKEFEYYAARRGYSVLRNAAYEWVYTDTRTEDAWEMYHHGHVKGRTWNET